MAVSIWTRTARPLAVVAAAVVLMGAALVNGQPFFTPDTQAYVRGPDVAVLKLVGARFASPWARTMCGGTGKTSCTPKVFCTVIAVTAVAA